MKDFRDECPLCRKPIGDTEKRSWLAFDQRTQTYTKDDVPKESSQGEFAFHKSCAALAELNHRRKTGAEPMPNVLPLQSCPDCGAEPVLKSTTAGHNFSCPEGHRRTSFYADKYNAKKRWNALK